MTTTDLVPVFAGTLAGTPAQLCNARDLHAALGVGRDFSTWIKERIAEYGFVSAASFAPRIWGANDAADTTAPTTTSPSTWPRNSP